MRIIYSQKGNPIDKIRKNQKNIEKLTPGEGVSSWMRCKSKSTSWNLCFLLL